MKELFATTSLLLLTFFLSFSGCSSLQQNKPNTQLSKSEECRTGWIRAKNVNTRLRLSCLRNNEEFEIFCPQESRKANGVCKVKWYSDGKLTGELITEYVEGLQSYENITFEKLITEYPYYAETIPLGDWKRFNHEIRMRIYFEAAREKGNFEHGGKRYQYPNTLVEGQTILDTIKYLEKYKKKQRI